MYKRQPYYYAVRNHIVDFLVSRSRSFATDTPGHDPRNVPAVRIGKSELVIASVSDGPHGEAKQTSWPGLSAYAKASADRQSKPVEASGVEEA